MKVSVPFRQHQLQAQVSGEGDLLVFVHGWPTNQMMWEPVAEALQSGFRVLRFDWLGHGQSDMPDPFDFSFTDMAEMLEAVLGELGLANEKITLVAHDIGGPAAIVWASEHPSRLRSLILLNTVIYPFSTPLVHLTHRIFRWPGLKQFYMSHQGLALTMWTLSAVKNARSRHLTRQILGWHRPIPPSQRLASLLVPLKKGGNTELPSLEARLESLGDRLHLVVAKADPLCYRHMAHFIARHPGVDVTRVSRSGHFLMTDQPEQVIAAIRQITHR